MELIKKNGLYYQRTNTAGRPIIMDDPKLIAYFIGLGHDLDSSVKYLKKAKEEAIDQNEIKNEIDLEISVRKIEAVKSYKLFKNFIITRNDTNQSSVMYYQNDINTVCLGSAYTVEAKAIKAILEEHERKDFTIAHEGIARLIDQKDWTRVNPIQTIDLALNIDKNIRTVTIDRDPHPSCVQGIHSFSLATIPYTKKVVTFRDVNEYLQDFLNRVEHHEYLCAILWSHFIGNLLPYVIYLRGDGGDGKTSFINMLGKLARSYANFDGGDRFNYFNMFGKSIIGLNENESSKLMQNRVVKSISGGNSVQIEGKGKNSFTGQVRGLILIDSNYDLELLNRDDEKRRLRYFEVKPIKRAINHVTIAQDTFLGLLGSTPNEFLNYCRVCYEKLNIPNSGGLIQELPNHEETFLRLTDPLQEHKFNEFFKQNIDKYYYVNSEGKCETVKILLELEKKFPKDQWIVRNFKKYLESKYKIKVSGKYFIGLSAGNRDLEEALPK